MTDYSDLVKRLRDLTDENFGDLDQFSTWGREMVAAADVIELLQRELKCANELWDQQKELALEYLDDIEKANERIAELEAALRPFAYEADEYEGLGVQDKDRIFVPFAACRNARKVLGDKE
jgi:hypothetical protein